MQRKKGQNTTNQNKKHMRQKKSRLTAILSIVSLTLISCIQANMQQAEEIYINNQWQLFPAATNAVSDSIVSTSGFEASDAVNISLPATVLSGLRQNGRYEDIFFNMGLRKVDESLFKSPWWYRKEVTIAEPSPGINYQLILEGINYKAELWINGYEINGSTRMEGAFGIYNHPVTPYLKAGNNTIAIKIYPPQKGDLTLGFVDWNPEAPDKNMGIWRGIRLKKTGSITLSHPSVRSSINTQTLDEADLTVSVFAKNLSDTPLNSTLKTTLLDRTVSKSITLNPGQEKEFFFTPDEFPELKIENPQLWWPNTLGEQPLHSLTIKATTNNNLSDIAETRFGIRQVEDYFTKDGYRGFKINGRKFLVKGAGWVDDMLLADTDEKVKAQINYVKSMNLNTIRLEGFWGKNNTLYDYCDEQGIMLMIGWSCQWEWESYCGRPEGEYMSIYPEEYEREARAYRQQVLRARNHPAMLLWTYGSDRLPHPDLERILNSNMAAIAPDAPVVTTCRGVEVGGHQNTSQISGPSGVKMLGPYDWVPPVYWYTDTLYGGAYGFNTETGPGPQIPPIESIKKMLPEENWWPMDSLWQYHFGRNEFASIERYLKAFNARYGESRSLEEFAFKNQLSNYEAIRGMFEAFAVNKYEATGVIQWMLNSAWPEMYWQLYDYYLRPNGAFYGTKKACAPLTPIFNYKDRYIYINNDLSTSFSDLIISIKVLSINSDVLLEKDIPFTIDKNTVQKAFELPQMQIENKTFFLDLRIKGSSGKELATNFYWLSTQKDKPDFEATTWVHTPTVEFADFKDINHLEQPEITLKVQKEISEQSIQMICTLENKSDKLAFFNELLAVNNTNGEVILPVLWDDNYISLLPGERRTINATIPGENLVPENISIKIKNLQKAINNRD